MKKIKYAILNLLYVIGITLIFLGAVSIPTTNIVLQIIETGRIVEIVFMWHWSMFIGLGAIVLGFIFFLIGCLKNSEDEQ